MQTLLIPSLELRILNAVSEEAKVNPIADWPEDRIQWLLDFLRSTRKSMIEFRRQLEEALAMGVEARSLVREWGPFPPLARDLIAQVREQKAPSPAREELDSTLLEMEGCLDLAEAAISLASKPLRPIDWERVRATEEAHAQGETKPFSRR